MAKGAQERFGKMRKSIQKQAYERSAVDKANDQKMGYKEGSKADEKMDKKVMKMMGKKKIKSERW